MYKLLANDDTSFINTKFLVSCPSDTNDPKNNSGAVYLFDLENELIQEVIKGADFRGMDKTKSHYFISSTDKGIHQFDLNFNLIKTFSIEESRIANHPSISLDIHGFRILDNKYAIIVETAHDRIGIYNLTDFERVDEIKLFEYCQDVFDDNCVYAEERWGLDQHHINDICIYKHKLYISMFSLKNGWRKRLYEGIPLDGTVIEYDFKLKEITRVLNNDLQMPHSINFFNGYLHVCNSHDLSVLRESEKLIQFDGFTRGINFDGRYFFIGQSEMRHLEKIMTRKQRVSLDCGIHIYDSVSKASRFIQLPEKQVYDILII